MLISIIAAVIVLILICDVLLLIDSSVIVHLVILERGPSIDCGLVLWRQFQIVALIVVALPRDNIVVSIAAGLLDISSV